MNSSLYECTVMHKRLKPIEYNFTHKIFMFYIDLDEVEELANRFRFLSHNRFNFFNFKDSDHLLFSCKTLKEGILSYLRTQGIDLEGGRIMLMTHLRTLGYVFNPVSFYFCFDRQDQPVCAIAEVGNTFGEMKPYFFNQKTLEGDSFNMEMAKYFYVSPFIGLDSHFDFKLKVPSEKLNIKIDGYEKDAKMLVSTLTGKRQELADSKLFWYSLKFPAVTVKVIALIHWHALKLYLNKLPYYKKDSHLDLQRGVHHGKKTT